MVKKCAQCGKIKDIREFRLSRKQQKRSAYCKKCEGIDINEYKAKTRKACIKKQIPFIYASSASVYNAK